MNKLIKVFLICLILEVMFVSSSWSWTVLEHPGGFMGEILSRRLRSVKMVTSDNGWAVGDRGATMDDTATIFRWDGSNWVNDSIILTTEYLLSIDMLADGNDGWIVGSDGTILRWNFGTQEWEEYSHSLTSETLWSVSIDQTTGNAFAVGNNCTILKWNGSSWSNISPSESDLGEETKKKSLLGVHMTDTDNGWAVGSEGVMLKCADGSWSEYEHDLTDKALWSVFMVDSDNGWAVGADDIILRYNGSWSEETPVSDGATLHDVKMLSATEGWIVGGRCHAECDIGAGEEPECTLLKCTGGVWSKDSAPAGEMRPARAVSIIDTNNVWVVGNDGLLLQGP